MKINEIGIKDYGRALKKTVQGSVPKAMDVVKMYQKSYPDATPAQIKDMSIKHMQALKNKNVQARSSASSKSPTPRQVADQLEKDTGKTIEPEKKGESQFKTPPMGAVIKFTKSFKMDPLRWDGRQWTSMDGVVKHTQPGSPAEKNYHEIYFQGKAEGIF